MKEENKENLQDVQNQSWMRMSGLFQVRNIALVLLGAVLALVFALPFFLQSDFVYEFVNNNKQATNKNLLVSEEISNLSDKAFGNFWGMSEVATNNLSSEALGLGGGGSAISRVASETDSEKMISSDSRIAMPYNPEAVSFRYIYRGDELVLGEDSLSVYRQEKSSANIKNMSQLLSNLDLSVIDLKQFSDAQIQNMSLIEDKDYGYLINLNFNENSFDLYQNWQRWPHPENDCLDEACINRYRLGLEDVPSDDELIAVAEKFVKKLGINLNNFGKGEVNHYWLDNIERFPEQELWVPSDFSIVFPLQIEGQIVYDQSGGKSGLNVSVNAREMKVTSLNSLKPYNFSASNYEAVTDVVTVEKMIEKGGWQNYLTFGIDQQADKTVDVFLGNPVSGLIRYFSYDNKMSQSEELFIPALIFPVEEISDKSAYFFRQTVVVPLIREIFEKDMNDSSDPRPELMLLKQGVEIQADVIEPVTSSLEQDGE